MFNSSAYLANILLYVLRIPALLIALTVHEYSHGYAANKLGDSTARNFGRLSLNPLKHLDPIGAIMMVLFGFGWAKPVPVNSRNFKKPRRDMALTAIAGPISNLILGFIGMLLAHIFGAIFRMLPATTAFAATLQWLVQYFLMIFYSLNLSLAVFNLIPVPPLDGSRLLFIFLPDRLYFGFMKYERYISLALMLLVLSGLLNYPLNMAVNGIMWAFNRLISLIPFL